VTRQWVAAGRVKVNGRVEHNPDRWLDPARDVVHLDGMRVRREKKLYIALNKPAGVITSFGDNRSRETVYSCIKELDRWVFPVGRLDMDTSGLLILTNDTAFGDALLNPASKIPKTYYVKVAGNVTPEEYSRLTQSLDIGRGEVTAGACVKEVRRTEKYTWFELTITEGKNRQVRRMCDAIGHAVLKLVRIRIGDFELAKIPVGGFVTLSPADLKKILSQRRSPANC